MKKSTQNTCAKLVKEMIKKGDGIKCISAFCKGYGVDTSDYSSPVHISKTGDVSIRYRNVYSYYRPHAGF